MNTLVMPQFDYGTLDEAYPPIDPKFSPTGNRVLFQLRTPKNKTKGGLVLVEGSQVEDQWNTQVAKVIKIGPVAFRDRDNLEPWPEGDHVKVGDFVRVPLYGGDRWYKPIPGRTDYRALFAVYLDTDIKGIHEGDPLDVDAFT